MDNYFLCVLTQSLKGLSVRIWPKMISSANSFTRYIFNTKNWYCSFAHKSFLCSHIDKVYLFFQWFILKRIQTSKYLNFSGLCLPIKTVRIGIHVCIECKSKLNKVRLHILKWELSKFPAKSSAMHSLDNLMNTQTPRKEPIKDLNNVFKFRCYHIWSSYNSPQASVVSLSFNRVQNSSVYSFDPDSPAEQ